MRFGPTSGESSIAFIFEISERASLCTKGRDVVQGLWVWDLVEKIRKSVSSNPNFKSVRVERSTSCWLKCLQIHLA